MSIKGNLIIITSFVGLLMTNLVYAGVPTITDVTAHQRYPWNGLVDISYTVTGDIAEEAKQRAVFTSLKVTAIDGVANATYVATKLNGDMSLTEGTHSLVWDLDEEGLAFKSSNVVFKVSCEMSPAIYCVIDLSAGADAASYPVTYLASPPSGGFNVDEYKTSKLVLRRIESGTFIMGDDQLDESHRVTITKPFFCGIFEMTQRQYELVTGVSQNSIISSLGSGYGNYTGSTYPVYYVSYDMIRGSSNGANWPTSSAVDESSFMGKLRIRTGIDFDLPTEAQWEYACRAGTGTTYSYGNSANGDYMWYENNANRQYHPVGTKYANKWGLYDMHGNGWEWCLDWDGTLTYSNDPKGASFGTARVKRGGDYWSSASACASSFRSSANPKSQYYTGPHGFRLFRTVPTLDAAGSLCSGASLASVIDVNVGTRIAAETERISYSTAWEDCAEAIATAILSVNGETLSSASGSGYVEWTPGCNGIYHLTLRLMVGDKQIGEILTTSFLVEGRKPVITPPDGTTFENSLAVSISSLEVGATIHYTTDGSEPTIDSPVYRRFRIIGRTTVKAIAEKNGLVSDVVTAEYALGRCDDPVITPEDGSSFEWAGQTVSIDWQGEDGVLRYTTDGSDPTAESPVYAGPFTISDTTIVKAKAFGDQFFDSSIVTANIVRVWTAVATPQIEAANSFTGSKTKVAISCATEGAAIRYTLDGSEPNSHSTKYTGPFYVTDSCTVKACAVKYDYTNSSVATRDIAKVRGIGDALGKPDHGFTTAGGGTGWFEIDDATAPNGKAMKSGAIANNQTSVLSTTVVGPGTLSFSWRTSCEDSGEQYDWDHVEFSVDGNVRLRLDGINSWTDKTVRINGDGEHTVTWTYVKDDVESDGDDAAYVAGYGWASDYTETKTTNVPVPYAWLLLHDPGIVDEFEAYEAAALATAANGRNKVWECYVAGISPTNETATFTARIDLKDGTPVVTWEPDLSTNSIIRIYKVYGSETLDGGGDWQYPTNSLHRFFKVGVEMP